MDVKTTDKLNGDEYNLSMSTDSARQASRMLHAAGLVDRVFVREDGGPWAVLAAIAGFIILLVVLIGGIASGRDVGLWLSWALKVGLVIGGLTVLGVLSKMAYDVAYARWVVRQRDALSLESERVSLEHHRMTSKITVLRPDEAGRRGVVFDGITYHDMDTHTVYTQSVIMALSPVLERLEKQVEAVRALSKAIPPTTYHNEQITGDRINEGAQDAELEAQAVTLQPSTLDALMAKYRFAPRLHSILIGEYLDQAGKVQPLTLDIPKSVHVICTGAPGLGKSTLLESIAVQLAGLDGVQLAAVDYGSGTFDALEDALRWQIADTPETAIALFRELIKLYQSRKEHYKQVGRVRSLEQYNAMTGEHLPFVACLVDETSALLEYDGTKAPLIELCRLGRKYGVGLLLSGTDLNARSLPSEAKSNCLARIAFWLDAGLSRSLLNCEAATDPTLDVGDVIVRRPGQAGLIRGHTAEVTEASYGKLARRRGQVLELEPVPIETVSDGNRQRLIDDPENIRQVLELHAQGESDTAIAREVFKHGTTFYIDRVRAILEQHNNSHNSADGATRENDGSTSDLRYVVDGDE